MQTISKTNLEARAAGILARAVIQNSGPRSWNFAACPMGGVCVLVQKPGQGPAKCRKCGK